MSTAPHADGAQLIAAERHRQITEKGWTAKHDDAHRGAALVSAASAYAAVARQQIRTCCSSVPEALPPDSWPWGRSWWDPSPDPIRNLVKAGALIAAEIDRLQRVGGAVR